MAIDEKYTDLINADIDGEISDSDKAELQTFLAESAEGRALHEELSALCSTLEAVEAVEPPPHLRHVIMNSVKPAPAAIRRPGFLQTLFATPAVGYAATFAVGVLLTLSLVNSGKISIRAFDDVTGLVGSVADPVEAHTLGSIYVDESAIAGTVSLRSSGSMLILDFDLVAVEPIEIEADYADNAIWFTGFAQLESSGTAISAQSGRVRLRMEGKRRYAVYLQNESGRNTTVKLRFKADGEVVHEASLDYASAR
ncbi:MAG: anti-sigma factor family protein [Woeseiaceae bacterium]